MILVTHPEYLLNSQDAFHKDGPQLVSNPRQQEAKERNAKYGIKYAKDFPAFRAWSYVSITCRSNESTRRKKGRRKEGKCVKKYDIEDIQRKADKR